MQLMQVYSQKSIRTTLPRSWFKVRGGEFNHIGHLKSGAGGRSAAASTDCDESIAAIANQQITARRLSKLAIKRTARCAILSVIRLSFEDRHLDWAEIVTLTGRHPVLIFRL